APAEEFNGCCRSGAEFVVGRCQAQMKLRGTALKAYVAVEALDLAFGEIAEAVLLDALGGNIDAGVSARSTGLNADLPASERAAHNVDLAALVAEAILHEDAHRAAERVEAK